MTRFSNEEKTLRIGQQHLSLMMAEGSVTKANLTHRTRLVQIGIKDHILPRRQIKGPRGIERDTSHRYQFGWWCQLIRHAPGTKLGVIKLRENTLFFGEDVVWWWGTCRGCLEEFGHFFTLFACVDVILYVFFCFAMHMTYRAVSKCVDHIIYYCHNYSLCHQVYFPYL